MDNSKDVVTQNQYSTEMISTPGTYIKGFGLFKPVMKEIDETTIKRAVQIYVDDLESIKEELVYIFEQDYLRQYDKKITFYKCVGAGYFELAVAGGVMKIFDN